MNTTAIMLRMTVCPWKRPKAAPVLARRPVYYGVSAATVLFCWGISALAVTAGL